MTSLRKKSIAAFGLLLLLLAQPIGAEESQSLSPNGINTLEATQENAIKSPQNETPSNQHDQKFTEEQRQALEKRVLARWEALIEHDFEKAYEYETPAYRDIFPVSHFRGQYGVQLEWRSAKIKKIEYDDSQDSPVATVWVEITVRYAGPGTGGATWDISDEVQEVWLYKDGQWWHKRV